MTTDPLISIVLPTFNGSRYLDKAIQSCANQSYSNWELIIVDDASTDATPDIIAQYVVTDARIRSIRHEKNQELPAALNNGFSHAKGDYLTWTSDDNCYRPPALAEMLEFLTSHPKVDIVYTDYTNIDEDDHLIQHTTVKTPEYLAWCNPIGPCFLYRRAVHERLRGYTQDLFLVEDYDFWLRASIAFELHPLHRDLYVYRHHGSSLTCCQSKRIHKKTTEVLSRNLSQMNWLSNASRCKGYRHLAESARNCRQKVSAWRFTLHAIYYSPKLVLHYINPLIVARSILGRRGRSVLRLICRRLSKRMIAG